MLKLIKKIHTRGFGWFIWRLGNELINPRTHSLKFVLDSILIIKSRVLKRTGFKNDAFIYGIYDLEVCPVTFNIIEFLCELEMYAVKMKRVGFVVVIVPAKEKKKAFISDYDLVVDNISVEWRRNNILVQTVQCHPMCKGLYLMPNRESIQDIIVKYDIFPELYDGFNLRSHNTLRFYQQAIRPGSFNGLSAPEQGRRYISNYIIQRSINRSIVTITIRDYRYDVARNSKKTEWARFADYLDSKGFQPIIIPDTDNAFDRGMPFKSNDVFTDCCWNVYLRMALYEQAFLNFSVLNGAGALMLFNPACKAIFMNTRPDNSIVTNDKTVRKASGYKAGERWKFLTEHQVFSPLEDTFENIKKEFEEYLTRNHVAEPETAAKHN